MKFSDFIKDQRSSGKKFENVKGLNINISSESEKMLINELTKQSFLAVCHFYLFKSKRAEDFVSPLVSRITFNDGNQLSKIKDLLGGGLQFLVPVFKGLYTDKIVGTLVFIISCAVMDYIRITTPIKAV